MSSEYVVAVESKPEPGDMAAIVRGLTEFNASKAAGDTPNYLLVTLRDAEGTVVGGLLGATYLGWLQVQALWLPEALRGGGHGRALMAQAEQEAIRRGCPRAFLETLSFQALPFYEKLGYKVFSKLPDFPPGGARYALTKELACE
ncbi:GNAT family N-acetyltransferase [Massilia agilis]|uniref:GNAT family N-acetyltransferase n=1 Tax=Massilia agilis TaxID=1811226 RepID=A0ABT2DHE2_9BURK|nr:GNAT family N-acetyltransferase [Massilia agilis]